MHALSLGSFVDATSLEALADMVLTDAKVAQPADSVTQTILVLKQEELVRQPVYNRNLAELMRYASGQFVNVLSRNDANWGAYAGLGPKYNTYLLDGLPIDSFVDPMSLDLQAIERIEMQKGPASVLYANYLSMDFAGNETPLAGTTNLVLRSHVDTPLRRVEAGLGNDGLVLGKLYTQGRSGDLSYMAGLSSERADYTQYGEPGSWLQTTENPDYAKTKAFAKLSYALGDPRHSISMFMHQTRHDGDLGRPNRDFGHRYETYNLTYNNQIHPRWHMQFKAGERRYDRRFDNDNFPANLNLASQDTTQQTLRPVDLTLSYVHGEDSLLTVGIDRQSVDYHTETRPAGGATSPRNDASATSRGVFVQEKLRLDDWVLRLGLRHNTIEHEYDLLGGVVPATNAAKWQKTLWSAGVRNNLSPGFFLFANVGTSFMVPSAKQIGGADGQISNPTLQPELGMGRDLGLDWQLTPATRLSVRAFLNTLDNAIVDNAVGIQTISVNAGQARAAGLEVDIRHAPEEGTTWFANLTRTQTRVENPGNADEDGTQIPFSPDLVANLGLSLQLPAGWRASTYLHWVGAYYDSTSRTNRTEFGHYAVLNVRAQKTLSANLEWILDLNNLTDRRFNMPWGFQDPGFNLFTGLNATF